MLEWYQRECKKKIKRPQGRRNSENVWVDMDESYTKQRQETTI